MGGFNLGAWACGIGPSATSDGVEAPSPRLSKRRRAAWRAGGEQARARAPDGGEELLRYLGHLELASSAGSSEMLKQAHSAAIERGAALQGAPAPAPSLAEPEDHADPYALPPASQAASESRAAASSAASAAAEKEKEAPFQPRSVKVAAATVPSPFLTPPPAASLGTPPQSERVPGAQRESCSGSGSEPAGSGSAPASSAPPSPPASRAPSLSAAEVFAAPAAAADGAAPRLKIVYSASSLCSSPSLRAGSSLALEVPGRAARRHTALVLYPASDGEEAEAGGGGGGAGAAGAASPARPAASAAGAAAVVLQRRLSGVYGAHHVQLQKLKAQMGDVAGARFPPDCSVALPPKYSVALL
jgi:hypothetical protein